MKSAQLLFGQVMHRRLQPRVHHFRYGIYYVALPLDLLESGALDAVLPRRRFALCGFDARDHGARDGSSLRVWADALLAEHGLPKPAYITLVCLPRILGYVFNPVSFWLCYDCAEQLTAVLCEVNNTFGESHTYVCAHPDQRPIEPHDRLTAQKQFHVSPFLQRTGEYRFRFALSTDQCRIDIQYEVDDQKVLVTCLSGQLNILTQSALRRACWRHPLVTLKAIALIHYQALRLIGKGIAYVTKPLQRCVRSSR